MSRSPAPGPQRPLASVPFLELRQYTLHPGRRDELIELFEREFLETQEAVGLAVLGQFRDLDAADRFVWLRGFAELQTRAARLATFYGGPVWKAHRAAANATMLDSDNVLLLREARPGSGLARAPRAHDSETSETSETPEASAWRAPAAPSSFAIITWSLHRPADAALVDAVADELPRWLAERGGALRGLYVTEDAVNDFPALPVRRGEHALVIVAACPDAAAFADGGALAALAGRVAATEVRRLGPTARSLLR